jgi:phenylpropionate dioxygenase-like ring-hydroxylating dioxygenase large terminal subunit
VINDTDRGGHQSDLRRVACNPNYWYPLAEVRQVGRNKTLGVSFGGEAIALARTETGKVFALEDRCAHRQFPLSKGVVCAGGELQCGYHSWRYNDAGQITRIPQCAPGAKPNRGVRAYPSREAYGLIFVFPGDRALAPHTPLPELPLFDSGDYRRMFFSRQVNCHYSFMHENLMDMNHQFLHRRLMGSVRAELLGHATGPAWVEARYHFHHGAGKAHQGMHWLSMGGSADEKRYDVMTIRTEYPYQRLTIAGENSAAAPSLSLWLAYVPIGGADRANRAFGMLLVRKPRARFLLTLAWPVLRHFVKSVFAEDQMAVEVEQQAYDAQGGDWNQEVSPVILDLRRLLRAQGIPAAYRPRLDADTGRPSELAERLAVPIVSALGRRDVPEESGPTR